MTSKKKPEEVKEYLIPEIEIRISASWIRIIRYCQTRLPNGQICFKIANAQPGALVPEHTQRLIRFDKEGDIPLESDLNEL